MRILLTGTTGLVGNSLLKHLIKDKRVAQIGAVIRPKTNVEFDNSIILIKTDEGFKENVERFNPEVVVHLASYLSSLSDVTTIEYLIDSNIRFGTLLLDALKSTNLKLFINTGSFSEYHQNNGNYNPTYLYSATKYAFRSIIRYYTEVKHFKVLHAIPYTIYGALEPKKKIIDLLIESLNSDKPLELSSGLQRLDFIHIDDIVDNYMKLVFESESLQSENEIHLGTNKATSIRELSEIIENLTSLKANVIWGARPDRERDTTLAFAPQNEFVDCKISLLDGVKQYLILKHKL
jgi:nucleoside-diphosphate-sugar epimerase